MARTWSKVAPFALISLVSFLLGAAILFAMLWKAEKLADYGLTGNFYYVSLLAFGLAAAGVLFGVLQSYAKYKGNQFGGVLDLGGPIVIFLLAVVLGFVLVPKSATFALTVFVHGPGGHQDVVLQNAGSVVIDMGPDRVSRRIGELGQAYFPSVAPSLRGQDVYISVESPGYESLRDQKIHLEPGSLYIEVRRKGARIAGRVQDVRGNPIRGATIAVAGLSAPAGPPTGRFEVIIPGERLQGDLELSASAPAYVPAHYQAVPGANDFTITLTKDE
jgi:hypothetical protein